NAPALPADRALALLFRRLLARILDRRPRRGLRQYGVDAAIQRAGAPRAHLHALRSRGAARPLRPLRRRGSRSGSGRRLALTAVRAAARFRAPRWRRSSIG